MKETLSRYIERHPLFVGVFGSASGISAAVLKSLHVVASVSADIGMLCGCATAIVTLGIAIRTWKRGRFERQALEHAADVHDERYANDDLP